MEEFARRQARENGQALVDGINLIEEYIGNKDWRVKENSNMGFSLQGLNFHVSSSIVARYWLEKLYPSVIAEAHREGDFHIHDLGCLSAYCMGWDLYDLLLRGFGGVSGKVESAPPKHFRSALGQIVNFLGKPIYDPDAKEFAIKVLKFMRDKIADFQEETGNLYNLEATPAEGTSYRLAKIDKKKFPRIKTAGTEEAPYYTNSCHLPVNYTDDIFEILTHQDDLQILFTGGTVVHLFIGEEIHDTNVVKDLVKTVVENFRLPYFSITPTFSVCPVHGYLPGRHDFCPYPHSEADLNSFGVELKLT